MDKRIYIKDWLDIKPYEKQTITDSYYLRICNDVKRALWINKQSLVLQKYLGKKNIDHLSCFLTSYLEDLKSGTNIWNTFVKMHKRLYKKQLPFYVLDEYTEEEINQQDVSFLIWYFLNTVQEEKFIAPFNDFIMGLSEKVMGVFVKAWVDAPKNEGLKAYYRIDEDEKDFYVARNLINTILFKTYLFYPDTFLKLREQDIEILEDRKSDENIMMFLNENRDSTLHNNNTRLLSLKGKEWTAEILGKDHSLSKYFLSLTQRIRGFFLYKGQDDCDIFIEHIASGKNFILTKKSFDQSASLTDVDTIIYMGIVKWKDEWWFSGVYFQQPFHPDLILDEKNSLESRMAVNFLDHHKKEIEDHLSKQLNAFKDFNKGSQIAFLSSERIDNFYRGYLEFFNNSLNLSAKEIEEAKQRARKDGFFDKEKELKDLSKISETGLVFYNPKTGVEIALGVNGAFPLSNNPFYNADKSNDDIMSLLLSDEMSTELAMFCIDNCKNDLPFFTKGVGKAYLKDIDFLLRFWKKENYYAIPSITFTGVNENKLLS